LPNVDSCQPQIIAALEKLGFRITNAPVMLRVSGGRDYIYADLRAERRSNGRVDAIIIVEVKCFPDSSSFLDEFYRAVGQFQTYRQSIAFSERSETLYLAIPETAYNEIQRREVLNAVVESAGIRLIVVNLEDEEVISWSA
jgi:hypothetical protein